MGKSIGKAGITVLAIGTAFGLGALTGAATTAYGVIKVAVEVMTELKGNTERKSTYSNYKD